MFGLKKEDAMAREKSPANSRFVQFKRPADVEETRTVRTRPLKITLIYTLLGALWIVVSDWFVRRVLGLQAEYFAQTVKGLFFIAGTSLLVFWLARRAVFRMELENQARQLHFSRVLIKALLRSVGEAVIIVDPAKRTILECNPAAESMFGYEREELLGQSTEILHVDGNSYERFAEISEPALTKDGVFRIEYRMRKKDGTIIDTVNTVTEMDEEVGWHGGVVSIVTDITERRRAEEALRERDEQFRLALDAARAVAWTGEVDGETVTEIGPVAEVFGKPAGFRHTNRREFLEDIHADDRAQVIAALQNLPRGGSDSYSVDFRVPLADGGVRWLQASGRFDFDLEGRPALVRGITRDITERKQAEEEKRNLEEQLQRAEKMEALGTLAGGVAHDLNNMLGIIVGYSQMLLFDVEESSSLRPGLVNILDGSQRAAAIIQDLLTLARRGVRNRQVHNLNKIVIDSQKSPEFENLSSYHSSVKIETDLEPDLLNISGSSVHISKTIFNLISNASEAMPKGGTLTIKTSNQYLDRPIQGYDQVREGDYVVLSVTDSGEGIPAADLKRIFEPFYTKKVMGRSGTGLGLAVVWGTVKDHQGYINVQSEEGKGSTFTLYFPVTRDEVTAEDATVPLSEYMGKGETILIVDDVKGQRDLAEKMLKKLNYCVTSAASGEEAVAYLKEHKVDLLVLDMIMDPGMDGLDTYKRILEIHPRQKAVIVSGFSESDRVHSAQALGAGFYVKKPYVIEKLGMAVRKELDRTT
jgi:PAS domain S-box-containing protein